MRTHILSCLTATVVLSLASPAAHGAIVLNFFPASAHSANTATLDAALGIAGYQIDTFESTALPTV